MTEKVFTVNGMSCNSCVSHVEDAVKELNGVDSVVVILDQKSMTVVYDEKIVNEDVIRNAVEELGYSIDV